MFPPHLINVLIHSFAGALAIILGFIILFIAKGTGRHRQLGKVFCYLTLVVCCSAITGLIFFRFLPVFAVISLLVLYQLVAGWRSARTKESGPSRVDAVWTLLAVICSVFLLPIALNQSSGKIILFSTIGALAIIFIYDTLRWLFPKTWHQHVWRYEHSYKLLSALFGMVSAFSGNVIRVGRPWSQVIPSLMGAFVIGYFFYRISQKGYAHPQTHQQPKAHPISD